VQRPLTLIRKGSARATSFLPLRSTPTPSLSSSGTPKRSRIVIGSTRLSNTTTTYRLLRPQWVKPELITSGLRLHSVSINSRLGRSNPVHILHFTRNLMSIYRGCLFFLGKWRPLTNELAGYPVGIPPEQYGTRYSVYTPDSGISCRVATWAPFIVEVQANTQKRGYLQTKRSYWQHGSLGVVKTIIIMTYQDEDVLDNDNCIHEVWKTTHRAHREREWHFPESCPSMTYQEMNHYRRDVVMAACANQISMG